MQDKVGPYHMEWAGARREQASCTDDAAPPAHSACRQGGS